MRVFRSQAYFSEQFLGLLLFLSVSTATLSSALARPQLAEARVQEVSDPEDKRRIFAEQFGQRPPPPEARSVLYASLGLGGGEGGLEEGDVVIPEVVIEVESPVLRVDRLTPQERR